MLGGYGPLELYGALDTPARRGEGGHKAIACAFDYSAVEARKLLPKNPVVGAAQGLGGIFAQAATTQCGRPHQVGEHDCNGAFRKILYHLGQTSGVSGASVLLLPNRVNGLGS